MTYIVIYGSQKSAAKRRTSMKKIVLVCILLLLASLPSAFTQIASIHYAEAFPELCIWVSGVPLVMAEGAESVRVSQWGESPKEGVYDLGYAEFFYENNYLVMQNGYDVTGKQEYSTIYVYENGYLTEIQQDFSLYNSKAVYYYNHYEDRTEVYMTEENGSESEWIKTIWWDANGYLTRIEANSWVRLFFYDDGFLVRAEEEGWGEVTVTNYTYTENGLLQGIEVEGEYVLTIEYGPGNSVQGVYLDTASQTSVSGQLELELNEKNDLSQLGPTSLDWKY